MLLYCGPDLSKIQVTGPYMLQWTDISEVHVARLAVQEQLLVGEVGCAGAAARHDRLYIWSQLPDSFRQPDQSCLQFISAFTVKSSLS